MFETILAYFDSAYADAVSAGDSGEVPVGAVVVHTPTGKIVGRGGNRTIRDYDPTAHAEIIALRAAAKALKRARLDECDLYVTLEPCPMCAGAISEAHIRRLYFGAYDVKGGGVDHGPRVFETCGAAHRPEVIGGIDAERLGDLLKTFFAARRDGDQIAHRKVIGRLPGRPVDLSRVDHFVLTVTSIDTTCDFYANVFGMEVVTFGNRRKALRFGHQKINLHQEGAELLPRASRPTTGSADFCLISDTSLDQVAAHLQTQDVAIEKGPVLRTGATGPIRSIYIRDPDHNLIEIAEYVQG